MKKIKYYFNSFLNFYIKKFFRTEKREVYIGKRKIDQFRRSIIKYRKVEEIIQYTCDFLKDFLSTQQIGFFYWHKELGHFVDYTEKENFQHKIQIFDPLILVLTEYDLILLKKNIELIRNEEHRKIILEFMNQKKANIVIPLMLNESVLGLIYAKTDKYINIADYFLLDELRYFVIVTLSNALIYLSLENLLKTLEERVKERTKELEKAHQTLLQQEKMATLGTMISGIAHELNTPIGVIQASSKQITENFETLIEIFFLKKDFKNLPDEFFEILYYFIFHLSISNSNVQTKPLNLKKKLKSTFHITNTL
jgi:Signal transduction histidine kinase regulating C4-dicarboxylate transport system